MAAQRRLNRDELIATALAVADADGLGALTVRRVAQRHDVTPMALYRHFPDKDGLLDAVAERLLADVRIPPPDGRPWHDQLRDLLTETLTALRPHPNATMLLFTRILGCEPGLDLTERVLALLTDAGLSTEQGAETSCQVLSSLVTLVMTEPGRLHAPDPEAQEAAVRAKRASLLALSPRRHPHVVAAADALADCASEEAYFRRGIELIVTGVRGVRPEPAGV
ncbi:TetR/AcrR family transcriptional regulator [Actinacidiphila sp. ITFR-21]|uniref:TetR/AcrR family transcriptional regulator n=1 Tax=Actinacidiphila sp. ITFR-21 TaxID=3075199 RepID=UPI002889894B|nr:TetR/AcrR family transcriptional regulator C-terminal domain-containing protein [Streptomyces sp. ITFR-21]WNI18194.1 TetR/AcrR family transcriptional regulator C-terminal domain-containing protein [Streptomyces sp. ITFR-21]